MEGNPLNSADPAGLQAISLLIIRPVPITVPSSPTGAGGLIDPIVIPNTGIDNACPPNPGNKDPCKGLRKDLQEHREKLRQYVNDPLSMDNKGSLSDAVSSGNMDRFLIIRATRIKSLLFQIKLKEEQLRRCEEKYGFS